MQLIKPVCVKDKYNALINVNKLISVLSYVSDMCQKTKRIPAFTTQTHNHVMFM